MGIYEISLNVKIVITVQTSYKIIKQLFTALIAYKIIKKIVGIPTVVSNGGRTLGVYRKVTVGYSRAVARR